MLVDDTPTITVSAVPQPVTRTRAVAAEGTLSAPPDMTLAPDGDR
jgi:hypothetical protein